MDTFLNAMTQLTKPLLCKHHRYVHQLTDCFNCSDCLVKIKRSIANSIKYQPLYKFSGQNQFRITDSSKCALYIGYTSKSTTIYFNKWNGIKTLAFCMFIDIWLYQERNSLFSNDKSSEMLFEYAIKKIIMLLSYIRKDEFINLLQSDLVYRKIKIFLTLNKCNLSLIISRYYLIALFYILSFKINKYKNELKQESNKWTNIIQISQRILHCMKKALYPFNNNIYVRHIESWINIIKWNEVICSNNKCNNCYINEINKKINIKKEFVKYINDNNKLTHAKYKKCKRCKVAVYCSKKCQKYHWNATHRLNCVHFLS